MNVEPFQPTLARARTRRRQLQKVWSTTLSRLRAPRAYLQTEFGKGQLLQWGCVQQLAVRSLP